MSNVIIKTPAQKLVEAETALHEVLIGSGVAKFRDQNGEEVTYTKMNLSDLRAYIRDLKLEIAGTGPEPALRFWF